MAVIKRGILGGFQNKIANVVGSSWKGIATMRSLPISVANPRTALQTTQRTKFSWMSKLGSELLTPIVKPLWDRFAQQESGYNAFVRVNLPYMSETGVMSNGQFELSRGSLAVSEITAAAFDTGTKTLTVTWDTTPEGDYNDSDLAYIAINFGASPEWDGIAAVAARNAGTWTGATEVLAVGGGTYMVYLAFRKADGTKVSNTARFGVQAT